MIEIFSSSASKLLRSKRANHDFIQKLIGYLFQVTRLIFISALETRIEDSAILLLLVRKL